MQWKRGLAEACGLELLMKLLTVGVPPPPHFISTPVNGLTHQHSPRWPFVEMFHWGGGKKNIFQTVRGEKKIKKRGGVNAHSRTLGEVSIEQSAMVA